MPPTRTPKPLPRRHPNTKRTGELAEAAFLVKTTKLALPISKPWGDSERYDFILDAGHCTWRVQIKCTESVNAGGYQVQSTFTDGKHKGHYTADDIDVLVAYILPRDLWYIVPAHALPASASLRFYPDGNVRKPRFEQYREAWDLFRKPKPARDRRKARLPNAAIADPPTSAPDAASSDDGSPDDQELTEQAREENPPDSALDKLMNQWSTRVTKLYKKK